MAQEAVEFGESLGAGMRRVREERQVPLEDVAEVAVDLGLVHWERSTVAQLERGRRRISVPELVLLPVILTRALSRVVALADLLGDPLVLLVGPDGRSQTMTRDDVLGLLGSAVSPVHVDARLAWDPARAGRMETALAAELGLPSEEVVAAARRLFSTGSARAERESRAYAMDPTADGRRRQALRGHAYRQVRDELKGYLEAAHGGIGLPEREFYFEPMNEDEAAEHGPR